jgi:hypothetical protein
MLHTPYQITRTGRSHGASHTHTHTSAHLLGRTPCTCSQTGPQSCRTSPRGSLCITPRRRERTFQGDKHPFHLSRWSRLGTRSPPANQPNNARAGETGVCCCRALAQRTRLPIPKGGGAACRALHTSTTQTPHTAAPYQACPRARGGRHACRGAVGAPGAQDARACSRQGVLPSGADAPRGRTSGGGGPRGTEIARLQHKRQPRPRHTHTRDG